MTRIGLLTWMHARHRLGFHGMLSIKLMHLARLFSKVLGCTQQRIASKTFRILQRLNGRRLLGILFRFRIETLRFLLVQRGGRHMIIDMAIPCHAIVQWDWKDSVRCSRTANQR